MFFFLLICFILLVNILCDEGIKPWQPIIPQINEPKDFKAFYVDHLDSCEIELIFKRDFHDLSYEYYPYAIFSDDFYYFLPQNSKLNQNTSLVYNEPNPEGQRGAFILTDNYVLTTISVSVCDIGKDDENFPQKYKDVKPTKFKIRAVPYKVAHVDESWWESKPFSVNDKTVTPINGGVKEVKANWFKKDLKNENIFANISWNLTDVQPDQIQSFFILIGPSNNAQYIQTFQIMDTNLTNKTISLGEIDLEKRQYDVAIEVWTIEGALTFPDEVSQVPILPTT